MKRRQLAEVKSVYSHTPVHEDIEVTLIDKEQPAHIWPQERLLVMNRVSKGIGDLSLRLTALRYNPQEGQSSEVQIDYAENGTITMEDMPSAAEEAAERMKRRWY